MNHAPAAISIPQLLVCFTRKPCDLAEVLSHADRNERPTPVVVTETHQLSPAEYDIFAETLLVDRDWLAGKGGYLNNATCQVVEVKADNRVTLYVDPSGSAYGRYVGVAVS